MSSKKVFFDIINESFKEYGFSHFDEDPSVASFLCEEFFHFDTYDTELDELFCKKAIEVCKSITDRTNFEYIADSSNYRWFITMVNMPFFRANIEWGTSIRGCWWNKFEEYPYFGLRIESQDDWISLISSVIEFYESRLN